MSIFYKNLCPYAYHLLSSICIRNENETTSPTKGSYKNNLTILSANASRLTALRKLRPDILAFSRLARRAPQHLKLPTYSLTNPKHHSFQIIFTPDLKITKASNQLVIPSTFVILDRTDLVRIAI